MRTIFVAAPALLVAGIAVAQDAGRPDPRNPAAIVPPVEFRSAFEGYRAYAEQDLRDWRKSNDEVGKQTPRPQAGKPGTSGAPAERQGAPAHQGHGAHK